MTLRRSGIPAFYANDAPMRCWPCLKGFFCPRLGREYNRVNSIIDYGKMSPCPKNFYQDERGKETCKRCPDDTATKQVGSTSQSDCEAGAVPPGYRFRGPYDARIRDDGGPTPSQMEHVPCLKGQYSELLRLFSPTSQTCTECGPGTYSPMEASAFCYPCPIGEYTNLTGQYKCTKCECEACKPKPGPDDNVNVRVNPARTKCLQAPENKYSVNYDDWDFTECGCTKPLRPKTEIDCRAPGVEGPADVQARRDLVNKCNKHAGTHAQDDWTNGTESLLLRDTDAKSLYITRQAEQSEPSTTDWLAITSIVLLLPLIFTSMVLGMGSEKETLLSGDSPNKKFN